MHIFMHGSHGGHGHHASQQQNREREVP
jgi:hypothetical protein